MKFEIVPSYGFFRVLIDGEEWKKIHPAVFGKKPRLTSCSSIEELEKKFDTIEYKKALHYSLRRLTQQSYYSAQLHKLLRDRYISDKNCDLVLTYLETNQFLNDEAWINSFIKVHLKKMGLEGVCSKLRSKGVPREKIQIVREEWRDEEQENEVIQKLIATRYRNKEPRKVIAALMRRGFTYESIKKFKGCLLWEESH